MIDVKAQRGEPIRISMEGTAEEIVQESVYIVMALVHELAHGLNKETAEAFLQYVRNVDDAGGFFVQMGGAEDA